MAKPIAVLLSDVHYNLQTLELADAATRMAVDKANELCVPLIIAGDLHDTKANMRAECMNAIMVTLDLCETECYILRGNHDSINEKSKEHALSFLYKNEEYSGQCRHVIATPIRISTGARHPDLHLIPYHHDPEELKAYLKTVPKGSTIIMHQGCQGSSMGDYVIDHSALPKECFEDFRVISGHYHPRQTIKCGPSRKGAVGSFDYIGNPYTLSFAEANDPEKGFQILMDDGTLEFVPTNLRKHVVYDGGDIVECARSINPGDLVWVKIRRSKEDLLGITKEPIAKMLGITGEFRLDLIPLDTVTEGAAPQSNLTGGELLDSLIDSLANTTDERKAALKELWRKSTCA